MMIIDEAVINRVAMQMIDSSVDCCYGMSLDCPEGGKLERGIALMTLGEIRGVTDMADRLKHILNDDELIPLTHERLTKFKEEFFENEE